MIIKQVDIIKPMDTSVKKWAPSKILPSATDKDQAIANVFRGLR